MFSQRLSLGMKLVLALLPIYYGGLLLIALPETWQWLLALGVVLVAVLVLCFSLDYPLQTVWPVFPGTIVIVACVCVLYAGAQTQAALTKQTGELIAMSVLGALYIAWGIRATWRAYALY